MSSVIPIGGWINFSGRGEGRGGEGVGSSEKKDSLQILGLPRLAYLLTSEQV